MLKATMRWIDGLNVPATALVRFFIGGLFIWMGWNKVLDPVGFLKQVHLYDTLPVTPGIYLNATAIVLPWLEIVCGVALILGVFLRGSALAIAVMLAFFTPAIFLRAWGIHTTEGTPFMEVAFDCGCGTGEVIIWQKLLKNTGLLLLTLLILFSRSPRWCLSGLFTGAQRCDDAMPAGAPTSEGA